MNVKLGSVLPVIGTVDPATVANTIAYTDVIDMSKYDQAVATLLLGNMAAETIDFACYTCNADGSSPVSLKAATQLAASAGANDGAQIVIAVLAAELLATDKRYIKFGVVTGNTTGGPAAVVVHGVPRYGLASERDLSTVAEIKQ